MARSWALVMKEVAADLRPDMRLGVLLHVLAKAGKTVPTAQRTLVGAECIHADPTHQYSPYANEVHVQAVAAHNVAVAEHTADPTVFPAAGPTPVQPPFLRVKAAEGERMDRLTWAHMCEEPVGGLVSLAHLGEYYYHLEHFVSYEASWDVDTRPAHVARTAVHDKFTAHPDVLGLAGVQWAFEVGRLWVETALPHELTEYARPGAQRQRDLRERLQGPDVEPERLLRRRWKAAMAFHQTTGRNTYHTPSLTR